MKPTFLVTCPWLLAFAVTACSGKVAVEPDGGTGSSSGGSSSGSSGGSTSGSSSGGSSGSTSGSSSGGSSGSSSSAPSPDACGLVCQRLEQLGCLQPPEQPGSCESSCNTTAVTAASDGCSAQLAGVLACLEQAPLKCNASGQLDQSVCPAQIGAFGACSTGQPSMPSACDVIPNPSGPTACTASGGSGGSGGSSSGSGAETTTTCSDPSGNTWSADCQGGTCACSYDGKTICKCATGGGIGCCPGVR
jgi:hypothetical protein